MTLKEFLKIRASKIIIFFVLGSFFTLLLLMFTVSNPAKEPWWFILLTFPGYVWIKLLYTLGRDDSLTGIFIWYGLALIWWYFITCLMVWFFSLRKKQPSQPPAR